MKIEIT